METQATAPEFEDLDSHRKMWAAFMGFAFKGAISTAIVLIVIATLTLFSGAIFLKIVVTIVALLFVLVMWMANIF